jgi:hypothetical protein
MVCIGAQVAFFYTNRYPKNVGTIHFLVSKDALGYQETVWKTTWAALWWIFHKIKERQLIGSKGSIQTILRRMKGLKNF